MPPVQVPPTLVEQVVNAIVSEIVDGELPSNSRLIQDELARAYGVSRQPIQQALLLLRDRGLVREAAGRGLIVSPIDVDFVRNLYEIRALLDGLAARLAAERGAERAKLEGSAYLDAGRAAVESGSLSEQIEADMRFHAFINELSGNSLIGETTAPHWPYLRRVMGEVLRDDVQMPQTILRRGIGRSAASAPHATYSVIRLLSSFTGRGRRAFAAGSYDPGASDKEVRIGQSRRARYPRRASSSSGSRLSHLRHIRGSKAALVRGNFGLDWLTHLSQRLAFGSKKSD
jgi:DNA-binding GntR family transcriptional regulator